MNGNRNSLFSTKYNAYCQKIKTRYVKNISIAHYCIVEPESQVDCCKV